MTTRSRLFLSTWLYHDQPIEQADLLTAIKRVMPGLEEPIVRVVSESEYDHGAKTEMQALQMALEISLHTEREMRLNLTGVQSVATDLIEEVRDLRRALTRLRGVVTSEGFQPNDEEREILREVDEALNRS